MNRGAKTKELAIFVKSSEVIMESMPQMILQLYILLRTGSWLEVSSWQFISLATSLATASLGTTEHFLALRQHVRHQQDREQSSYSDMAWGGKKLCMLGNCPTDIHSNIIC